jgi:hypothetical protein
MMTMYDAPSDRDYAEYLNPEEPEPEREDAGAKEQQHDAHRLSEADGR